ncbi:MAG: response regulator [bacterium]
MEKIKVLIAKSSASEINAIAAEIESISKSINIFKAETQPEALAIIQTENPEIVILDINMIDSEGNTILSTLKDWNFDAIIKTSGKYYKIHKENGKELGYILKPIEIDSLINKCLKNF